MRMPDPDPTIIARKAELAAALRAIVGPAALIDDAAGQKVFETDALTAYRQSPLLTVLPGTRAEAIAVLKTCAEAGVKIVPRGAGTSLSGGALPLADGVVIGLSRLNRILEIDYANRCAVVEPGVANLAISHAVADSGFYYAPDPSSQVVCTIGGNVAENSGGVHCLKYGLTTNNLLGLEMILATGEIVRLGGKHFDAAGYDLMGIIAGSEGLLGLVTEVTVRLLKRPEAARAMLAGFATNEAAGAAVAAIIRAGIIPAGLEMMDRSAILAVEAFAAAGYPQDAEALLILELDGAQDEVDDLARQVGALLDAEGAFMRRESADEAERLKMWAGRKAAFPAIGRLTPDYLCMDGSIPRRRLPEMLKTIGDLSRRYRLGVANVFHAGDGNLHPLIMYDANKPGELAAAEAFGADILKACVAMGGVLSGEHGIGIEKRDLMPVMFSPVDLDQQQRLKCAFDPGSLLNPGKVFPSPHRCAEFGALHVHGGRLPHPDLPRF